MSTSSETGASSSELFARVQSFLAENKKAILIGTAATVVAIGGAAYYASSSRTVREDDVDSEKGEKRKEKKKPKGKKKKSVKDKDGPLLEERKPKAGDTKTSGVVIGTLLRNDRVDPCALEEPTLSADEIAALSTEASNAS